MPPHPDPQERLSRLDGPTFIQIMEVRAREDGLVFACTGVRGLLVVDASDPSGHAVVVLAYFATF